jgi:hypothetical protein
MVGCILVPSLQHLIKIMQPFPPDGLYCFWVGPGASAAKHNAAPLCTCQGHICTPRVSCEAQLSL